MIEDSREHQGRVLRRAVADQIGDRWGWFVGLGAVLILAGSMAILFPVLTTLAANVAIGAILLAVGFMQIFQSFGTRRWDGFAWTFLSGLLYLLAGAVLAFFPLAGVLTLTVLIAALLIATGVVELVWASRMRGREGWGWMLVNGVAALLAGAVIALGLPGTALWVLGLLVGLNFALSGARFIALGLAARRGLDPNRTA